MADDSYFGSQAYSERLDRLEERLDEQDDRIKAAWPQIVGEEYARASTPLVAGDNVLVYTGFDQSTGNDAATLASTLGQRAAEIIASVRAIDPTIVGLQFRADDLAAELRFDRDGNRIDRDDHQIEREIKVDRVPAREQNESIESPKTRTPPVDMIGNYVLIESTQKVNPQDGMTYEVSAGEYPVMGLISDDGKRVENAGIVFRAASTTTGELVSVVEKLRPIDIPALVQRQQIRMEAKPDRSLRYPLAMFLGAASDLGNKRAAEKRQTEDRAQEQTQGQKVSLSR